MRDVIKDMNKRALSDATGISYSRLRKYSSGQITKLTQQEKDAIYLYLQTLSLVFKGDNDDRTDN